MQDFFPQIDVFFFLNSLVALIGALTTTAVWRMKKVRGVNINEIKAFC